MNVECVWMGFPAARGYVVTGPEATLLFCLQVLPKALSLLPVGNCLLVRQGCGNLANLYFCGWKAASCHRAFNLVHLCFAIVFLACKLFIMASEALSVSGCDKKLSVMLKALAKASL